MGQDAQSAPSDQDKSTEGVQLVGGSGRVRLLAERWLVRSMSYLPGLGRGGRFTRQVMVTLFSQVLTLGFTLATSAIVARWLGQEGKGIVVLALLVPGLLALFLEGGIAAANVYFAGSRQIGVAALAQNTLAYLLMVLPLGAAVFAVLFNTGWLEKLVPGVPLWLLLISVLEFPFRLLINAFCGILRGLQRITLVNLVTLLDGLITFLFTVLLVIVLRIGPAGALLASLAAVLVNTVWVSVFVRRYGGCLFPRWNRPVLGATFFYGVRGYIANILTFFNYRLDMLLVNQFLSPAEVGVYSVSTRLAELLWYFPNAVSFVLFPKAAASQVREMIQFTPRVLRATLVLTAGGALLLALLGRPLIVGIYSSSFASAYLPLLLLLPGVVLLGGEKVLSTQVAGRGYPHYNSIASVVGLVFTVMFDLTLIPRYGVAGASVASTLAYGSTFVASFFLYALATRRTVLRESVEPEGAPSEKGMHTSRIQYVDESDETAGSHR